jgi:hypothetical protein
MLEMFQDVAGGSQVRTLDDIQYFDDIWVIKLFEDVILSFDFGGLDGHKHFDHNFLFCFYVFALEDMGVLAATNLMGDGIILQFAALMKGYPQGSSMAS